MNKQEQDDLSFRRVIDYLLGRSKPKDNDISMHKPAEAAGQEARSRARPSK